MSKSSMLLKDTQMATKNSWSLCFSVQMIKVSLHKETNTLKYQLFSNIYLH